MFHSMFTSHRFHTISNIGLALVLALGMIVTIASFAPRTTPQTMAQEWKEGSNLEYDLIWGKGNRPAENQSMPAAMVLAPDNQEGQNLEFDLRNGKGVTLASDRPASVSSVDLELDLRWGKGNRPAVTGTNDFSYSYWLVVGPGGGKPVQIKR